MTPAGGPERVFSSVAGLGGIGAAGRDLVGDVELVGFAEVQVPVDGGEGDTEGTCDLGGALALGVAGSGGGEAVGVHDGGAATDAALSADGVQASEGLGVSLVHSPGKRAFDRLDVKSALSWEDWTC
ncbi:MAG: hypothetical protein JWP48_4625 [Actinoallomurus sp.]|jgi:hypothetical protein|nr:hypothetical protein [Actinoallomurus sp.]